MAEDYILDEEELYRNVRKNRDMDEYRYDDTGKLLITSQAFRDTQREPSVDRAKLRYFDPKKSRISEGNGIVSLLTLEVRQIGIVISKDDDSEEIKHAVDVNPDPKDDNKAHGLITVQPEFYGEDNRKDKTFKKLRKALAKIATKNGWTLKPEF